MAIHAFVLHLLRAEKRRANAHELKDICGLEAEIWPAVDGSVMSATDLASTVGTQLFEPAYPFPLKTGEIGCFLSHRQIWAEIIRRDIDAALIIEDDAGLDPAPFDDALDLAIDHIQTLGYIQFQTRPPQGPKTLIDTRGDSVLVVPQLGGLRTTAQMVSGWAARLLLAQSDTFDRPVDTFVQSHWQTGLRPAMIHPSGVFEAADTLDGSTIQGGKKPLLQKLGREISRSRYRKSVSQLSRDSAAPVKGGVDG